MIIDSIDALLEYAERARSADCQCPSCAALGFVVQLLQTPMPCGWPRPEVDNQNRTAMVSMEGMFNAPTDEVRGLCVAMLRACDRSEGK